MGGCFYQLPLKIDEKEYIQHNAYCRGNRGGKTDPNSGQHGKADDLAGNTVTGGSGQSQPVDKGAECQKGNLGQTFLQCQRDCTIMSTIF